MRKGAEKPKSEVPEAESTKKPANLPPVAPPAKVDYATELFNLLSMDNSKPNGSHLDSANGNPKSGIQDLKVNSRIATSYHSEKVTASIPLC